MPTFMDGILGVHNLALMGSGLPDLHGRRDQPGLLRRAASSSQSGRWVAATARVPCRAEAALFAKALWLFLVGTVVGGIAVGLIFRGGLSELNRLAEPRNRAATVSTFFVAAYLGLGLPAVLSGVISRLTGIVDASVYTSVLAAAFVVAAIVVVLRTFGTASAPEPSSTPSDTWR